jgi:alkylation response protein AidB-like acyl-CoA dehydrogenase
MDDLSSPSVQDYLRRARAIAPLIEESAPVTEATRRVAPPVIKALIEGGFYRMLEPRFLGGGELSLSAFAEVIEEIAKSDASTAWCLAQCSACAMAAAYLDRETALEVFGPPDAIVAWGPVAPSEARMVDGGYRVTGTWNFASGGHQSAWLGGQCHVLDRDGKPVRRPSGTPRVRMMLFRYQDAQITDVWNVMGLKGTGSDTYGVKDHFVPERYSFQRDEAEDRRENGLLFKFSTSVAYSFGFAGVALGIARRMLDDATELASEKTPGGTKRAMRNNNVIQANIGRSEAAWRSARTYLHATARNLWQAVAKNPELTLDQKIEIRLAATWAIHQAAEVADTVFHMVGSTAVFQKNPFERRFRDIHTLTQQLQGRQSHYENVGQVLLGLDPDALLFTT